MQPMITPPLFDDRPLDRHRKRRPESKKARVDAWRAFAKNNHDWDWSFLLETIDFKLARMAKAIRKGVGAKGWKKERVAEIESVRERIERVLADEYQKPLVKLHEKKWGKRKTKIVRKPGSKTGTFHIAYAKAVSDPDKKLAAGEFHKVLLRAAAERQTDIEELFSLMASHLQKWWD